jgi:hypothetical protein
MRVSSITLAMAVATTLAIAGDAMAEPPRSRTETMPFEECLSLIDEVAADLDAADVTRLRNGDRSTIRIDALDGIVTVTCTRADNKLVLSRESPQRSGDAAMNRRRRL